MRKSLPLIVFAVLSAIGCNQAPGSSSPTSPSAVASALAIAASDARSIGQGARNEQACWGEATEALARLGEMGYHASHQDTPRLGLRNVARLLYDLGVLPDDSLQALAAFLSSALGLSIDSCR